MTDAISRALLGKIVDEVFDGAIEDASVIAEIYAVIKREEANLSAAEPVKPYGYVYESTVRYFDGRGPHRKVDFSYSKKNISDDDIEEFEISETAVYMPPPAPSVAVNTLEWEAHGEGWRGCGSIIYDVYPAAEGEGWWAALSMAGYLPFRERCKSPEAAKAAAQADYEARIRSALSAQAQDVAAIAQLNAIVDAWEALPGGRQVRNSDVEAWLRKHMAPAINAIRAFLNRPLPDGA